MTPVLKEAGILFVYTIVLNMFVRCENKKFEPYLKCSFVIISMSGAFLFFEPSTDL